MNASAPSRQDQRATVTVDREGIIHQWGDVVAEITGHTADEAVGQNLNIVIPPVLRRLHWWGFDRAMKRGRLTRDTFKLPALRKDGRIVVAHANMNLIPGKGGGVDGAVVTFSGVGALWQAMAWRAGLAPINLVRRIWHRA